MKYNNLPELFLRRAEKHNKQTMMRFRRRANMNFEEVSWAEVKNSVAKLGIGLRELGVRAGERVGLLSLTCPDWVVSDFAIMSLGAITVPLYHSSTTDSVAYIVNHSELEIVIVRNKIQLQKLRAVWDELPSLKYVIVMLDRGDLPENNPKILTMDEVLKIGESLYNKEPKFLEECTKRITLDDVASIIYTSGTTGVPKGVVLTHRNILIAALSFYQYVPFDDGQMLLSFLPLAHIFERVASEMYGIDQGSIFTYCEKVEDLPKMLLESGCHVLNVVPRILEKIHEKVMHKVSKAGPLQQRIFKKALEVGIEYTKQRLEHKTIGWDLELKYSIARKTILDKVKNNISPSLKIFVVGGAPFSIELNYFYNAIGFTVVEGYGLTETSAPISVNPPWANKPGTVGIPFKHFEVKTSEEGEIICRGDSVFKEYYKNPEATQEAIIDGWFHTGDLGEIDEEGYIKITGRKKDIIITAGGKNVSPVRVENEILQSKYLSQIVVLGDREKYLAALVVLNRSEVKKWLDQEGVSFDKTMALEDIPEVSNLVEEQIRIYSVDLGSYEQIKAFHLIDHEFTIDSGELTPTLKVRRNVIREKYRDIIKPLFNKPKS